MERRIVAQLLTCLDELGQADHQVNKQLLAEGGGRGMIIRVLPFKFPLFLVVLFFLTSDNIRYIFLTQFFQTLFCFFYFFKDNKINFQIDFLIVY